MLKAPQPQKTRPTTFKPGDDRAAAAARSKKGMKYTSAADRLAEARADMAAMKKNSRLMIALGPLAMKVLQEALDRPEPDVGVARFIADRAGLSQQQMETATGADTIEALTEALGSAEARVAELEEQLGRVATPRAVDAA